MAEIHGEGYGGISRLDVRPILCASGDAAEYEIGIVRLPGGQRESFTFSVAGWASGHTSVWLIARLFAESPRLPRVRLPIDLHCEGRGRLARAYEFCDWLRVVMWPAPGPAVCADVYITAESKAKTYHRLFLRTNAAEAERFGVALCAEIQQAAPSWWTSEHPKLAHGETEY